jgi:hypothetical protein
MTVRRTLRSADARRNQIIVYFAAAFLSWHRYFIYMYHKTLEKSVSTQVNSRMYVVITSVTASNIVQLLGLEP